MKSGRARARPNLHARPNTRADPRAAAAAAGQKGGRPDAGAISRWPARSALLDSHAPLLEAIRILYARLTLAGFGTRRRTLLIASELPGEGKTFVTLALARLARASGRRVLVIETGLRQPVIEEALGGPPSPGLAGYLVGGPTDIVRLPQCRASTSCSVATR